MNDKEQGVVDEICRRFELECGNGDVVRIADFLGQAPDKTSRTFLLRKLIAASIKLRSQNGEAVTPEDYEALGDEGVGAAYLAFAKFDPDKTFVGDKTKNDNATLNHNNSTNEVLQFQPSIEDTSGSLDSANDGEYLIPGTVIGKYKINHLIGEGGMGSVWMAHQERPVKRMVALKVIRSDLGSRRAIARFEAERQALAMMNHPNIARVFDAGTTIHGSPYFVMELVDGIPITEYCDENNLDIKQRLDLLIPVCKAVQHAHQKGIIHRDLKPSNVLVPEYDGQPQPKVIDFGLAKALDQKQNVISNQDMTKLGQVVGTLRYMSPEQAGMDDADVDTRTDVYSMGVIMYELITGSTPLEKSSLEHAAMLQLLNQIKDLEPPRPSIRLSNSHNISEISKLRNVDPAKLRRLLRGDLDWIVMKALDKERDERYQSVSGLADDLKRFVDGDEVLARPPTAIYRLQKFVSRNRGLVASVLAIAVLLLGGIVSTSWFAVAANRAKQAFAITAKSEKAQRLLADQKSKEALENEKLALDAKETANEQRNLAVQAQGKLARQLQLSEVRQYASALQQSLLAHQSGAFNLSTRLLDQIKPEFRQWEYYYLKQKMKRMVPYHLSAALMDANQGLYSVNSAIHDGHAYIAADKLLKIDLKTGSSEPIQAIKESDVCAIGISNGGKWLTVTTFYDSSVYELATMKLQLKIKRDFNWVVDSVSQNVQTDDSDIESQIALLKISQLRPNVFVDKYLVVPGKRKLEIVNIEDESVTSHDLPISNGYISGYGFDASLGELYAWYQDRLRFIDIKTGKIIRSFAVASSIQEVATIPGRDFVLLATNERIIKASKQDGKIIGEIPVRGIVDIKWAESNPDLLFLAGNSLGEALAWDLAQESLVRDQTIRIVSDGFMSFEISPDGKFCVYSDSFSWVVRRLEQERSPTIAIPDLKFAELQDPNKLVVIQQKNGNRSEVISFDLSNRSSTLMDAIEGEVLSAGYDPGSRVLTTVVKQNVSGNKISLQLKNLANNKSVRDSFVTDEKSVIGNNGQLVLDPSTELNILDAATAEKIGTLPPIETPYQDDEESDLDELDDLLAEFENEFPVPEQIPSAFTINRSSNLVFHAYSLTNENNADIPRNSTLVCYDLKNSAVKFQVSAHLGQTNYLKLDANENRLFSCGSDGKLKVWDADSGIELLTIDCEYPWLNSIALNESSGTVWYSGRKGVGRLDSKIDYTELENEESNPIVEISDSPDYTSQFLLRASPYQSNAPLKIQNSPIAQAIELAEEWFGIKIHATKDFLTDTRRVKLWGTSKTFDEFMARLTRRKKWSYFYVSNRQNIVALIVPEELFSKIGLKNISRVDAESIEELRPLLDRIDQQSIKNSSTD